MPDANYLTTRQRHYWDILGDLFDATRYMTSLWLLEFVCTLVRAGGLELGSFDPWYESKAIVEDLNALACIELPTEQFPEPDKTRIRLALLSYCTLTETCRMF
jgi:hypothetical protein